MNDFEGLLAGLALPDPFYGKVLRECRNHRLNMACIKPFCFVAGRVYTVFFLNTNSAM